MENYAGESLRRAGGIRGDKSLGKIREVFWSIERFYINLHIIIILLE